MSRFLFIGTVVVGLHFFVLTIPMLPQKSIKPTLAPIKRIAVSFITRPTTPKEVKKVTPEPLPEKPKKKEIIKPNPQPEKLELSPEPKIKQLIKQKKIIMHPVKQVVLELPIDSPPQKVEPTAASEMEALKVESPASQDEEKLQSKFTATVIQEATPLYKTNPPPSYPRLARRRGIEGVVFIDVFINISGEVKELKLAKSSGHRILDKAAIKSVRKWQFIPGNQAGKPVEMWVTVPVHFKLMNN